LSDKIELSSHEPGRLNPEAELFNLKVEEFFLRKL
jgi:hypothetical protein